MKSIKINIALPKASELSQDLNTLLSQVQSKTKLSLDIDVTAFKTSIAEVSQLLGKLKTQISSMGSVGELLKSSSITQSTKDLERQNVLLREQQRLLSERSIIKTSSSEVVNSNGSRTLLSDLEKTRDEYGNIIEVVNTYNKKSGEITSTIINTTSEVEKQRVASEKALDSVEKVQSVLQNKLNSSMTNKNFTLIDDSVFTNLQNRINSLNADTAEKEINDLKIAITNLGNSDSQIVRLQNAISKYEIKIDGLKGKYKDIVPENELNEAISKLESLKKTLNSIQGGDSLSNKNISSILNDASSSMNRLSTATKNANQEAITFGSAFKDIASKVGLFSLSYTALNEFQQAFREGIQSVIQMDDALTDLAKVVDLNNNQLLQMRDNAVSMGEALGRSAVDVAKAQAEFGRQYKDIATINEMTRASIIGANVMDGASSDEVAKGLTTIINSLKLESKDAIPIIDSLNEVQNNYRISASSMLNALAEVGSTAKVAGADINQLQGYITAMSVATGKSGDEIGNSLRSITSRIYKIGTEGIESAGKPEKMLNDMGVAVRDLNNEFRPLNEILTDLNGKWRTMSETQKIGTAQTVAGVHRYNDFMSLMENFDMAVDATATSMNSLGSATKENEIYLQSISGKMESLKATTQGFWFDFIDSDMLKGGVDGLRLLMDGLSVLQGTFGSLGLSVGALTTVFLLFTNNPLKKFTTELVNSGNITKGFSQKLTLLKTKLSETTAGMSGTQKASFLLKTGLDAVGNSAVVTQIKVIALQTVLSMGIGLAIGAVIGVINSFVSSLGDTDERIEDVNQKSKELADTLNSYKDINLSLNSFKEINEKLKETTISEEERNSLNNELIKVKEQLATLDDSAYSILNNQNLSYEEQLSLLKQINEQKLYERAEDLDKTLGNGFWNQDESKNAKYANEELEKSIRLHKQIQQLGSNGGNIRTEDGNGLIIKDSAEQAKYLKELESVINENYLTVQRYNSNVELMKRANYDTDRSTIQLDGSTRSFVTTLNQSTDAVKENTKAKEDNANSGGLGEIKETSVEEATQKYGEAVERAQELDTMLQKINEKQSLTPDIVAELAKNYSELGAGITDINQVQTFLNDKISEQVAIQEEAYQIMMGDDKAYYESKVKNSQDAQSAFDKFASQFVDVNGKGYNFDLKNFGTLNQAKAEYMNLLSKPLSEFLANLLGGSAKAYEDDLRNTRNYAEVKSKILAKLDDQISKAEARLNKFSQNVSKSATSADALNNEKFASNALKDLKTLETAKADIETSFNEFYASFNTSAPTFGTGSSLIGKDGKADEMKKNTKKLSDALGDLSDRYWDVNNALKQLDNELKNNKTLMENGLDREKINYLKQQLQLIDKQKNAYKNLNKEYNKELSELRNSLSSSGFSFAGDGTIKNYQSRLDALTANADLITDSDRRESVQKNVKAIAESLERYNELLLTQIPEINNELLNLENTASSVNDEIKSIYREKLENVVSVESQISELIKKNAEERIEAEKKALENSIENDRKRIESKKKALQEEQDLYNKQYSEDNYEAELNEERNKLLQLQADIDKLQFANDRKSQQRLQELLSQYEAQQKLINDKIAEHQNQEINDRFEKEQDLLDKELENKESIYDDAIEELDKKLSNFLSPQNLTNLVSTAMKSGFVNILGETVNLNKAMNEMFVDTEVGIANLNLQYSEWLTNLNSIKDVMFDINKYMDGAGVNSGINLSAKRNANPQTISVDMGGIVIEGNVDRDILADLDKMFKKQQDEIVGIVTRKLSGK